MHAALVAVLAVAGAEAAPADVTPLRATAGARVASVVPGLVLHGAGHFVAGDRRTAGRLALIEGVGLGTAVGAIVTLGVTGASRRIAGPLVTSLVGGLGLFAISGLSDIYGVFAPPGGTGAPALATPWIHAEVGTRFVYDPSFAHRSLVGPALDLRWPAWRLASSAWLAANDDNARLRALGAYRLFGPRTPGSAAPADATALDVSLAFTHHRYGSSGFDMTTGEISLDTRVDLRWLSPTLAGSFADGGVGAGLGAHRYTRAGVTDLHELLLVRFGYGLYLGQAPRPSGEVSVYYDHRHDDFAGGLKTRGLASGAAGHFGFQGIFYPVPRWGFRIEAQAGSAYVGGLSLLFRHGTDTAGPSS